MLESLVQQVKLQNRAMAIRAECNPKMCTKDPDTCPVPVPLMPDKCFEKFMRIGYCGNGCTTCMGCQR